MEEKFQNMDFGLSTPTSVPMEEVQVDISSASMIEDYAKAFVKEAYRVAPLKAEQVKISEEEVVAYATYLLTKRIECVNGMCPDFRLLKLLFIPSFIQYVLSMVGIVVNRAYGLKFTPIQSKPSKMTYDEAKVISEKIGAFIDDLQVVQDGMPRDNAGNPDVMSSALIAGYVRSFQKVEHPAAVYVTAFLNMRLKKETAFQALYRIQYEDYEFLATAFSSMKGVI